MMKWVLISSHSWKWCTKDMEWLWHNYGKSSQRHCPNPKDYHSSHSMQHALPSAVWPFSSRSGKRRWCVDDFHGPEQDSITGGMHQLLMYFQHIRSLDKLLLMQESIQLDKKIHLLQKMLRKAEAALLCTLAEVSMIANGMSHDLPTHKCYYESHGTEKCAAKVHNIIKAMADKESSDCESKEG